MLKRIHKLNIRFFPLFTRWWYQRYLFFFFTIYRDTIMATVANSAHKKRTRPRGFVPANVSRHHRLETTHRNGRQQRWPFQIRQARQISHQIEIGLSFSVQLPSSGFERYSCTDYNQTIASGSCKLSCNVS